MDGRNHEKVALAYSENSKWRNRNQFINGREEIKAFLTEKWSTEGEYRLIKEVFAFEGNRISVRSVSYTHLTLPTICSV